MKLNFTSTFLAAGFSLAALTSGFSQSFSETFNDITTLAGSGWVMTNASAAVGSTNWFQGSNQGAGGPFDAYNGAANAYIGANYNNTGNTGTISNWLMSPNRTLRNGDVLTFWTRKPSPDTYADRLEVRMSTNGASTNVGTGTSVGDYTTLLLSINPSLVLGVYPTTWTMYTITISGLSAPSSGRLAFRYFVEGAGLSGTNSDYIGIDQVDYTPYVCPSFTMTAGGALTGGTAGTAYSTSLTQTGALGTPNYAVTAGALPPGMTLSSGGTISGTPTATGTFNFTATVSDASGCSGSQSYSITVVCPANPIAFSPSPVFCSNDPAYTLAEGSPAGGTYSGTGVTGGMFAPSAGTQSITYNYTDSYGCAFSSSYTITVNTQPSVSVPSIPDACMNEQPVMLPAGTPAGGTYSGTGVTGMDFDPSVGSQTLTYTYTDGNGCTNTATTGITVNTPAATSIDAVGNLCDNSSAVALTATPAGGTFSGTGVSGGMFNPSMGTQTVTYVYTDMNGCSDTSAMMINVNPAPMVTLSAFSDVCSNAGTVTLSGQAPAGGTFSGTGVTSGSFDPAARTQTITYSYTDANGCSATASQQLTVNAAPTVAYNETVSAICSDAAPIMLTGGSPAGGTYSGNGVSGSMFSPSVAGIGITTITYSYTDMNGCSNTAADAITVQNCLGLEKNTLSANIYPNPSTGTFFVTTDESFAFAVTDYTGKVILNGAAVSGQQNTIDLGAFAPGVYMVVSNGKAVARLIRQ